MQLIGRAKAKEQGRSRYFTGKPCKHGHISDRYVTTGTCVECSDQKNKTLYGGRRPSEGTNGCAIWDALDVLASTGVSPTRAHAVRLAADKDWNENNVATELGFWRKFNKNAESRAM